MSNSAYYIEKALREYPQTRSDDRKLLLTVWWLQDENYSADFARFFQYKAIMPETITRGRRKFQEQGKYPATEQVDQQRFEKFKATREVAPRTTEAAEILNIFDN